MCDYLQPFLKAKKVQQYTNVCHRVWTEPEVSAESKLKTAKTTLTLAASGLHKLSLKLSSTLAISTKPPCASGSEQAGVVLLSESVCACVCVCVCEWGQQCDPGRGCV